MTEAEMKKLVGEKALKHVLEKEKEARQALETKFEGKIPQKLPNPATLTFSGASTETYDGSKAVKVEIPVLEAATADKLGGIKADARTAETDTVEVKIGDDNKLYVPAAKEYKDVTTSENGLMLATDKAKLDKFSDADDYAKKEDLTTVYRYKGSLDDDTALEAVEKKETGDVYDLKTSEEYGDGTNVAWNGESWDPLGMKVDLSGYVMKEDMAEISEEDIDTIWNEVNAAE